MRLLAAAVALLAGSLRPASQAVEVLVLVPEQLGAEAEKALREELPRALAAEVRRWPLAEASAVAPGTSRLLFGATEFQLFRLARDGALLRDAVPGTALPPRGMHPERCYGLLLAMPYTLAFDPASLPVLAVPANWTELATMPQLDDRLGLVAPEVDPVPWLAGMTHRLLRGESEAAGFALWLALDARAGRYAASAGELEVGLDAGRLWAAVLPEALCVRGRELRGLPVFQHRELADGMPMGLLGIAVQGAEPPPLLTETIAKLCSESARARIAARLGMLTVDSVPTASVTAPDWQRAEGWLAHFQSHVAGRGRALAGLDQWLDLAFGVAFVVFLVFVWSRLRRSERGEGESPAP